jgi:hypothetical protein
MENIDLNIDVTDEKQTKELCDELNNIGYYADLLIATNCHDIEFIKKQLNEMNDLALYTTTTIGCLGFIVHNCSDIKCKELALIYLKDIKKMIIRENKCNRYENIFMGTMISIFIASYFLETFFK